MKIEKIEIQTSNKKHATDIAMLVDKPEFLKEIKRLREKWDITKLEATEVSGITRHLDFKKLIQIKFDFTNEADNKYQELNEDIDAVLKIFLRGKNFRQVVLYALFAGVIPSGIYKSCYFDVVTINESEDLNKPENYQYVIVLSPRTEKKEVLEAFNEFKKHILGKIKFHNRTPIENVDEKELGNAIGLIKSEYERQASETKETATYEEFVSDYQKVIERTKNAYEFLLSIGDLDIDFPEHKELIEQFHKGNVYNTGNKDKYDTRPLIDQIRQWYWIRNYRFLNGESDEPLTPVQVCREWQNKCPINRNRKLKDKKFCECEYCIDPVLIMKHLKKYEEVLILS